MGGARAAAGRRWLDPGRPAASLPGAAAPGQHAGGTPSASLRPWRSTSPPGCRPGPRHGSACMGRPGRTGRRPKPLAPRRSTEDTVTATPQGLRGPTPRLPRARGCRRRSPHPGRPARPPYSIPPGSRAANGKARPVSGRTAADGTRSARGAPRARALGG